MSAEESSIPWCIWFSKKADVKKQTDAMPSFFFFNAEMRRHAEKN